jgi:hypothetical protein
VLGTPSIWSELTLRLHVEKMRWLARAAMWSELKFRLDGE